MLNVSVVPGPPVGPSVKIHHEHQDTDKKGRTSLRFFGTEKRGINPPPDLQPSDPKGVRYYVRDRDLGQTFSPRDQAFRLEVITLRTGPADNAVGEGVSEIGGARGAAVSLQILTVSGEPTINKNHTPKKTDDFITGETYTSLRVITGGKLPND